MDELTITLTLEELNAILMALAQRKQMLTREPDIAVANSAIKKVAKALAEY